jgi:hypothetical protein
MTTTINAVDYSRRHNGLMYFNFQLSLAMLKLATACTVAHGNERFVEEAEDLGIAGREAGH